MNLKFVAAILLCGTLYASAQQQPPAPANPNGKVIFSRSADQPTDQTPDRPSAPTATSAQNVTDKVTDADRNAVTITEYDLDLHLAPRRDHTLSARAPSSRSATTAHSRSLLSRCNSLPRSTSKEPASTANVSLINNSRSTATPTTPAFFTKPPSQLPTPLAPRATLSLAVVYSGTIDTDARRLVQLGTPDETALHSDWDRISEDFTGLRGFGNVVWYPVSSIPALLGDTNEVFTEIGRQKLSHEDTTVSIHLTIESISRRPPPSS